MIDCPVVGIISERKIGIEAELTMVKGEKNKQHTEAVNTTNKDSAGPTRMRGEEKSRQSLRWKKEQNK